MRAINIGINVIIAALSTVAAVVCAIPSVDFLRQYDTYTVAFCIMPIVLLVFFFVLISGKWQTACSKGMMILSLVLLTNFAVDVYEIYFASNADTSVGGAEQKVLESSSFMFFIGAAIMAMVSVMMLMFGNEQFGSGFGNRVEKMKIPKF